MCAVFSSLICHFHFLVMLCTCSMPLAENTMEYIGDIKPIRRFNVSIANGFLPRTANMFLENYHSFLSFFQSEAVIFISLSFDVSFHISFLWTIVIWRVGSGIHIYSSRLNITLLFFTWSGFEISRVIKTVLMHYAYKEDTDKLGSEGVWW